MGRSLPPLAAVRAFEAAARHRSFTAAAEELNVTQSAVSHQVKRLEAFFGKPLFVRTPQGIEPTEAARDFQCELTDLLNRLQDFTQRLAHPGQPEVLRIRATPAFITRWLLPRMHDFSAAHPDIDYEVDIGFPPTDFSKGDVDVFIHWGTEPVEGARVEPFFQSARTPVASPDFLERSCVTEPSDLLALPLIYDMVDDAWEEWFNVCGLPLPPHAKGPRVAHCELALVAAELGQGVDLSYLALIEKELESGKLVRLFDEHTLPFTMYSIAYREVDTRLPKVRAFRNWLLAQTGSDWPCEQKMASAG
jgi:LysR family glycine cleavage system transcriptional activator